MYLNCIFSPIVVSLMAFLWPQHTDARITLTLCVMRWWRRSRRRSSSSNTSNGNVVLRFHLNYMSYWCVRFQVLCVASVVSSSPSDRQEHSTTSTIMIRCIWMRQEWWGDTTAASTFSQFLAWWSIQSSCGWGRLLLYGNGNYPKVERDRWAEEEEIDREN